MKLICIIGSSAQKTLLPLLYFQGQYSSVVFVTPKQELETAEYIRNFIDGWKDDPEHKCTHKIEIIENSPCYEDFYETIYAILWESFIENEEPVLNVSGGTADMILAGVQAARAMKTPVMYVDSNSLNIQIITWKQDGIHTDIQQNYVDISTFAVKGFLALCNFYPAYLIPDESLKGIQYERWVYSFFQTARENGVFASIDRNVILTWHRDTNKQNEIDIVFIKNRTIGFVSVKSGKTVDSKPNFNKTKKELKNIYPEWLLKLPCLKTLISRHSISARNKNLLADKGILVFDNVAGDADVQKAIADISVEADKLYASFDFTQEEIIEKFSEVSDGYDFF